MVIDVAVSWRSRTGRGGMLRGLAGRVGMVVDVAVNWRSRTGRGGMLRGLAGRVGMVVDAGGGGSGTRGSRSSLPSDAAMR